MEYDLCTSLTVNSLHIYTIIRQPSCNQSNSTYFIPYRIQYNAKLRLGSQQRPRWGPAPPPSPQERGQPPRRPHPRDPYAGPLQVALPLQVCLPVMACPLLFSRHSFWLLLRHTLRRPLSLRQHVRKISTHGGPSLLFLAPRLLRHQLSRLLQWTSAVQTRRYPPPAPSRI